MGIKGQKKNLEVVTAKSVDEILSEIKRRADLQIENRTLLIWEPVDYRKFEINENQIQIERSPTIFNPFKGQGSLTIKLQNADLGTKINCLIDPYFEIIIGAVAFFSLFSLVMTIMAIITLRDRPIFMVLFIIILWIIVLGGVYIGHKINLFILENYFDSILTDLGIRNQKIKA
jgi:hypothetical protein